MILLKTCRGFWKSWIKILALKRNLTIFILFIIQYINTPPFTKYISKILFECSKNDIFGVSKIVKLLSDLTVPIKKKFPDNFS